MIRALTDSVRAHTLKRILGQLPGSKADHIHYPPSSLGITLPLFCPSLPPSHAVYTGRFNEKVCTVLIV